MRSLGRGLSKFATFLDVVSNPFGVLFLSGVAGVTFASVILRYALYVPLSWREFAFYFLYALPGWIALLLIIGPAVRASALRILGQVFSKFTTFIFAISVGPGVLFLVGMAGVTFISVVLRYGFNSPLSWTETILSALLAWSIFLIIGPAAREDAHIKMGFVLDRLVGPKRAPGVSRFVENWVGLVIIGFFTVHAYRWVLITKRVGLQEWGPEGIVYPLWVIRLIVPIGLGFLTLFYLERCIKQIASFKAARRGEGIASEGEIEEGKPPELI